MAQKREQVYSAFSTAGALGDTLAAPLTAVDLNLADVSRLMGGAGPFRLVRG